MLTGPHDRVLVVSGWAAAGLGRHSSPGRMQLPLSCAARLLHTLPDDFSTWLFGFLGSFYLHWDNLRNRLLNGRVLAAQESRLLREIHVLHKRHAALQS